MGNVGSGGSRISQTVDANPRGGGCQPIIWQFFPENCMKMKEIGPWGRGEGAHPQRYVIVSVQCRQWVPGAPSGSANGGLLAMGNVGCS